MSSDNYVIRTMLRSEIDMAIDLAADEGWNPGLYDADSFFAADPDGFFISLLNDDPIGCISAVNYKNQFGFIGFYIIKPGWRGKGYGLKLWKTGVDYLKEVPVTGLDGVVDQQDNYKKSGFKLAYSNVRFEGKGTGGFSRANDLIEAKEVPFELLNIYDSRFFPASRPEFLSSWINQPESLCLVDYYGDSLNGYGMIRKCRSGYKIGPLFAENEKIADKIFSSLRSFAPKDEPFYLDIPEVNPRAVELTERYNMNKVFETARMYTGSDPGLPVAKIFGVTTFELG